MAIQKEDKPTYLESRILGENQKIWKCCGSISRTDFVGRTALHLVANDVEYVKLRALHVVNINAVDLYGETVLHRHSHLIF
jgi:hypothetical protein